ncbi:hypothetical protein [Vibrio diabolicus]|uniref:hypothetical protein n=1 Tax=Vibrio diabolicus TaxID=50719 RepID=UPI0035A88DBF
MFHNIGDYYEKRYLTLLILLLASSTSLANVTPPDCDAEKTTKTVAKKTVVGIGSCCTPKETLKDTAIDPRKDKLQMKGWRAKLLIQRHKKKERKTVKRRDKKAQ